MADNDARREQARARLQVRLGTAQETTRSERSLYSAYDESHGVLSKPRTSHSSESLNAASERKDLERIDRRKSHARVSAEGRRTARRFDAPMVGNVRQGSRAEHGRGVVVGRDSRNGWTGSVYHSDKRGLSAVLFRLLSLVKGIFGGIVALLVWLFGFLSRLPLGRLAVPLILVAALVAVGVKFVPSLLDRVGASSEPQGISSPDGATPSMDTLVGLLGEEDGTALYLLARFDDDRYWVASHPDALAVHGEDLQLKLLQLATNEMAAAGFVRGMAESYPAESAADYDGAGFGVLAGYPVLYQWDERWGCLPYRDSSIGLSGCAPTVMSIVYQGITGSTDMSPDVMAAYAKNNGYVAESDGSDVDLVADGGAALGLAPAEIDLAVDNLIWTLESEVPIIANLGPGDFSDSECYVVLVGLDTEGKVLLIDPYSSENTLKSWDPETIVSQSKHLYACYA